MKNLKTGYYQADTNNGVTFLGDSLEDENQDLTLPLEFLGDLSTLGDDEIMVCFFDESSFHILEEIEQEYGIR